MKPQMTEQLDLMLKQIARERLSLALPECAPIYRELSARTGFTRGTLRHYVSRRMKALRTEQACLHTSEVSRALAGWGIRRAA
jgi:hypothetical protein